MANLINLKEFDTKLNECVDLLGKLNQKHFLEQQKKGDLAWTARQAEQIEMLAQAVVELQWAVVHLAHNNRDGRG